MMMFAHRLDVSHADYHADPCETPSLSSSIANVLLEQSPKHAWLRHPRLGGTPRAPKAEMEAGSVFHQLVLGGGPEVVVVDAKDWRTKRAQLARKDAREQGKIAFLERDWQRVEEAVDAVAEQLEAAGVPLGMGERNVQIAWTEQTSHGPIACRAELDWHADGMILDLKSCESAHPRAAASSCLKFGYTTQRAAYVRALGALYPDLAGRIDYRLAFCELERPFAAGLYALDGALIEHGERRWKLACETWAQCLASGEWPAYPPQRLEAPGWLQAQLANGDV